jgi:hypothetical protein
MDVSVEVTKAVVPKVWESTDGRGRGRIKPRKVQQDKGIQHLPRIAAISQWCALSARVHTGVESPLFP